MFFSVAADNKIDVLYRCFYVIFKIKRSTFSAIALCFIVHGLCKHALEPKTGGIRFFHGRCGW